MRANCDEYRSIYTHGLTNSGLAVGVTVCDHLVLLNIMVGIILVVAVSVLPLVRAGLGRRWVGEGELI